VSVSFFFHVRASAEPYTLSLHDALPIYWAARRVRDQTGPRQILRRDDPTRRERGALEDVPELAHVAWPSMGLEHRDGGGIERRRSEEHTSELQSRENLVCRLLLEKKKKK